MNITPTNESPDEVKVEVEKIYQPEVCWGCGYRTEDCRCSKNEADIDNYEESLEQETI